MKMFCLTLYCRPYFYYWLLADLPAWASTELVVALTTSGRYKLALTCLYCSRHAFSQSGVTMSKWLRSVVSAALAEVAPLVTFA